VTSPRLACTVRELGSNLIPHRDTALAGTDPGPAPLREAVVVMAATLASFGTALLIEHFARLTTSIVILAVALAISIGRRGQRTGHRGPRSVALAAVILPFVAVGASEIGTWIFQQPDLGDALFVLAISATIWVRRFGPAVHQIAVFATFPLVAMLIVPAPAVSAGGPAGAARWWSALVAVIAFGYVTAARLLAERAGLLDPEARPPRPPLTAIKAPGTTKARATARVPGPARSQRRIAASTKMAVQMAVALGAAFAAGRALFGLHWTWVVLTAFIVCSGNRGRGDVVDKAAMRLVGAGAGTLAATVVAGLFPPGDRWSVVAIFAVLGAGLWLRYVSYAFWAAAMTAALALLYGYYGQRGVGLLGTRLEAIAAGAVLAVAASWFLLPVRTTDVLRRDLALALGALDRYRTAADGHDPGAEPLGPAVLGRTEEQFRHAVRALDRTAALLRRVPAPLRPQAGYLSAVSALEECAARLPAVTAALAAVPAGDRRTEQLGRLRGAVGELRRASAQRRVPDPVAWERLAEVVSGLPLALAAQVRP
jgi:hypothetical protein